MDVEEISTRQTYGRAARWNVCLFKALHKGTGPPFERKVTLGVTTLFKNVKAVVFDYGNTLVEFSKPQITACDTALADVLSRLYGKPDLAKFITIRNRDRLAPYQTPDYRENNLVEITNNLVQELYGIEPSGEEIATILRARFDIFVRVVHAEPYVFDILQYLKRGYRLGILSNYPDGNAIRASLKATGLDHFFDAVVVSGDLGVVKPHPVPFLTIQRALKIKPTQAVLVGDNWLGDIHGAKTAGMWAILTDQWQTPEVVMRNAHYSPPDAVIHHLTELKALL